MKRNALVLVSIFAFVPLADGLYAQATSERATTVTQGDLDKELNQLKSQVVEQRKVMNEQQRQHEKMIQQQREFANQQAAALANQREVVAEQAATIDQQNDAVTQQRISLTAMQKVLYVAAGLIVFAAVLLVGFILTFRKRTPNVEKQATGVLHIAPQANETPRQISGEVAVQEAIQEPVQEPVTQPKLVGPRILPNTLVDPTRETLRKLAQKSGPNVPYTLRLQNGTTFSCLAVFKNVGDVYPATRFVDYPEVPEMKWEDRMKIALGLLRDQVRVG